MSEERRIPAHVAIIMDGNGRWAKQHHISRSMGHREGAQAVERAMQSCLDSGVRYLTLFCFSSENWKRPAEEVSSLMALLEEYLSKRIEPLAEKGICVRFVGRLDMLPEKIRNRIEAVTSQPVPNERLTLILALSYGGRWEIVDAARRLAEQVKSGVLDPAAIDETLFSRSLYLPDVPDPDLMIRTSGEKRLSNFLLWQTAYTEVVFTDTLWPDFSDDDFRQALEDYASRHRRFGNV